MGATLVGRFELGARVAQGAMGSIHRGRDPESGQDVAIKVLSLDGETDRARFAREANMLALLEHPHVVRYIAHGVTPDGLHYLVQEWIEGITLRKLLRTTGVTGAEAVTIASGLVEALGAAHALGIVHRDVKPDNVILAGGDPAHVELVDFGVARMTDAAVRLTRTGTVVGTPSYMSPEQARGLPTIGAASDVWAAGCVLYEMLAGRLAYAGRSPTAVRAKVLLDRPPPLEKLCPEAVPSLRLLVEAMLARDPAARPTIDEIRAILRLIRLGDGPRRVVGAEEPTTQALRAAGHANAEVTCYVFFGTANAHEESEDLPKVILATAERHALDVYTMEDGSAVLVGRDPGRMGALEAARAALELKAHVADAAISIVAHRLADPVDATIERGVQGIEQATMGALFGEVVEAASSAIRIDPAVAELVADDLEIEQRADGPVLLDSITTNRR